MSTPDRSSESIERFILAIRMTHALDPDMRVGQIIESAMALDGDELSYIENDNLTHAIDRFRISPVKP